MFARVARYEVEPERTPAAVDAFREAVAELEGINGLEGGYVLTDADDGVVISMTLWESRTAMEDSEEGVRPAAAAASRSMASSSPCTASTS